MADLPDFAPALGRVSSGLYIVTTGLGDAATGFLASWVQQAGFAPPVVTICSGTERPITQTIRDCGQFCVSVVAPGSMGLLKHFGAGFAPGEPAFEGLEVAQTQAGITYPTAAHAWFACKLLGEQTWSDHTVFAGEVIEGACPDLSEVPTQHVRKNGLSY